MKETEIRRARVLILMTIFVLIPVGLWGQDSETPVDSFKNPGTAVMFSAFFPGAGQVYNEKWLKAGILSGLEVFTLYRARSFHQDYQIDSTDKDSQIRRNKHLWYAAGVYVYAMLDAYVDAHLSSFPEGNLVFDPVNKQLQFALILEF